MRKAAAPLAILIFLAACVSDPRTQVRKSVVAVHEGLYLPAMTTLGQGYDAGDPWVISHEPQIQRISEEYVKAKDAIGIIVRLWDAATSPAQATAKLHQLTSLILELQTISDGGGR